MVPLDEISDGVEKAKLYNLVEFKKLRFRLDKGAKYCSFGSLICIRRWINALLYDIEQGVNDEGTQAIYRLLMQALNGFAGVYVLPKNPPKLTLSADQTRSVGGSPAVFTASIIQGSAPISSIVWQQLSGPSAVLSGQNTNSLTVSQYAIGQILLSAIVTDNNGMTDSKTAKLTVSSSQVEIRYDAFDEEPDLATAVLTKSIMVNPGSTTFDIPFGLALNNKYIVWSQPSSEPDKLNWFNTEFNYGFVPDGAMKGQVTSGGRDIIGSRDIFSFDSTNYSLNVSV